MNRIRIANQEYKIVFQRTGLDTVCAIFEGNAGSLDKNKTLVAEAKVTRHVKDVDNRVIARTEAFKRAVGQIENRAVRTELFANAGHRMAFSR